MSEIWTRIPSVKTIMDVVEVLKKGGFEVFLVETRKDALAKIKGMIPRDSGVMVGGSVTLEEIGFREWLKAGDHGWKNLYAEVTSENDEIKRSDLRRKSMIADYFLAGVNAITQQGELVACDMSGSRIGAYPFAAKNLILVSGVQKIVEDLEEARRRVRLPLNGSDDDEDVRFPLWHGKMGNNGGRAHTQEDDHHPNKRKDWLVSCGHCLVINEDCLLFAKYLQDRVPGIHFSAPFFMTLSRGFKSNFLIDEVRIEDDKPAVYGSRGIAILDRNSCRSLQIA
jgi:hypothetical protein